MIIKSMSRKERSFGQLVGYIERDHDDSPFDLYHNIYAQKRDGVIAEFQSNAEHLNQRKNGNVMYHEIVSITRQPDVDEDTQKQALKDLARAYIAKRAPECLVFGTLHDDTDHSLHYHLVISANGIGESKRHSLKRADYKNIKLEIERLCNDRYPELNQGRVMDTRVKERGGRVSEAGYQRHRRTGRLPRREALIARVSNVLTANQSQDAVAQLAANQLEFYQHGNQVGVVDQRNGRRHRLRTLGLLDDFEKFQQAIELSDQQPDEAERIELSEPAAPISEPDQIAETANQYADEPAPILVDQVREEPAYTGVEDAEPAAGFPGERDEPAPRNGSNDHHRPAEQGSRASQPAPIHDLGSPELAQPAQEQSRETPSQSGRLRQHAGAWSAELKRRASWVNDWRHRHDDDHEDER